MKRITLYLGIVLMLITTAFSVITTDPIIQTDITQSSYVNITSGSMVLNDLLDGKHNYSIQYNTSFVSSTPIIDEFHAEGTDTNYTMPVNTEGITNVYVLGCAINSTIDGIQIVSGGYQEPHCEMTFEINQSTTANNVSYGLALSDGTYEFIDTLSTLTFNTQDLHYVDNTKENNLSTQHFKQTYTVDNQLGLPLENVEWSLSASNDIDTFNFSTGSQSVNKSIENDIIDEDLYYTVDNSGVFDYGTAYAVWKVLNITNPYTLTLDPMLINFTMLDFSDTSALTKYNGSEYLAFSSNNESGRLISTIDSLTSDESDLYNVSFNADIITKTMPKATFIVEGSDGDYERHYSFTPNGTYYSNFGNLSTVTFTDTLTRVSYLPDWNNRLRYNITADYNSSALTINDNALDEELEINFTIDDATIESNFQIDYYITEIVSDATGSSGGGGGESVVIIEIPADVNKSACDLVLSPVSVKLTDANLLQEVIITNDENQLIDPDFNFLHIDGDSEITDNLRIVNDPVSVQAQSSSSFGLTVSRFAGIGSANAELIITTEQCKNLVLPIEVDITQETTLAVFFQTPLMELADELFSQTAFTRVQADADTMLGKFVNKLNTVGGLATLLSALLLIMVLPIYGGRFAQNIVADILIRLFLWVVGTGVILLLMQSIFS